MDRSRPRILGPPVWLLLIGVGWTLAVWLLAVRRHLEFRSYMHDLGIFEHLVWNTAHGHFLDSSIYASNYLGVHFSPALILFVPGYLIWPDARALLLMQTIVIALGAVPLYLLARQWLGTGWLAATAGLIALLQPYSFFLALADFHPDALALPLLGTALFAIETGRYRLLALALPAFLLIREDFALAVIGLGLYVLLGRRQARLGGLLLVAGLVWLGLLVLFVIPSISGRAYAFADVNPELGSGPLGLLVGVLDNPPATLRHIVSPPRPEYVVWLLGPLLGLPVLRPVRLLPGLPLFARNLLAAHPSRVWINRHYHAAILPAVLVAAIAALAWLPRRWARRLAVAALAATIAFNGYAVLGLLGTEIPVSASAEANSYRAALQLIPPDAAVAASNRLGAHLAGRRWLWFFPADGDLLGDPSAADWVAVDLADRAAWLREQTDEELYARLRATYPPDQFDEVYRSGSVLVLQRRAGPAPGE